MSANTQSPVHETPKKVSACHVAKPRPPSPSSTMKKKNFKDGQKDGQKKVDAPDDVNVQAETTWQAFDHYVAETPDGVVSVEAFGVEAAWQEYKALFKQRRSNNETKRIKGFATEREMLLKMEKLMNLLKEFLGEPSGYRCDKPACCEWWGA